MGKSLFKSVPYKFVSVLLGFQADVVMSQLPAQP